MHLKAHFFSPLFLKAQPPNAARKASLLQTSTSLPAAVSQALVSFIGHFWHSFPLQVGPVPSSVRSAINHSKHTTQMWNFSCKEQVFTVHIPPFFAHHRLPVPGRWDGFPPHSAESIYPWNAVASGRFLPFKTLHICCSKHKVWALKAQNFCAPTSQDWGLEGPFAHQEKAAMGAQGKG